MLSLISVVSAALVVLMTSGCSGPAPVSSEPSQAVQEPSEIQAAPVELVDREMLILTGGVESSQVSEWVAEHKAVLSKLYPNVQQWEPIQSDGVDGLKPGFSILAPSVCAADKSEKAFYAALHDIPGSYVRSVRVPEDFGTCAEAVVTDWWQLSFRQYGERCMAVQADLEPVEPVDWPSDMNVNPGPPEGEEEVASFAGPCPKWWSAPISADRNAVIVNTHASDISKTSLASYLLYLGDPDDEAVVLEAGGAYEAVYFEGNEPLYAFLDQEAPPAKTATDGSGKREMVYEGNLSGLFTRWGLGARSVTPMKGAQARREFMYSLEEYVCIKATYSDENWLEREHQIVIVDEGMRAPYCTDHIPADNFGFRDSSLKGSFVPSGVGNEMSRIAGAEPGSNWSFAGMSGTGSGDLAVSVHTEIGSNLTGYAVAYNGKAARPFDGLKGRLVNFRDLDHGRALLCTDQGYGLFQSRTGEALWWEDGGACPVALPY